MKYTSLDGLRGIFSLLVVLFHLDITFMPGLLFNQFWIRESYILVDFFFILSGFVIALHYTNRLHTAHDFFDFMRRRFKRIYPLLFFTSIVFLANLCTNGFTIFSVSYFQTALQSQYSDILETLLLSNATPMLGTGYGINYPSWTVSAEMISYFIFAWICLVKKLQIKTILVGIVIIACVCFMLSEKTYFFNFSWGFIRGLLCFMLGFFVNTFNQTKIRLAAWLDLLVLPVIIILMYALNSFDPHDSQKQLFALLTVPLTFAMSIAVMLKSRGYFSQFLEHRIFQFLGRISYSTYLNHALVITVLPRLAFYHFRLPLTPSNQYLILLACMVVLIGYSYLTNRVVEGVRR